MSNYNYDKQREKLQLRVNAASNTAAAGAASATGGLLLGLEGLAYNLNKNHLRENIRTHKKLFSEDTKAIRNHTTEGRSLYNEYFDWARRQTPPNNFIDGIIQDIDRTNFERNLKIKGIELQGARDIRDLHKKYLKQDIKDLRKLQQRGFLRSANKFPLIAGVGFLGAGGYYANKARNIRAELSQDSAPTPLRQKTASSNLPDRLRYTHTIDTEVVPDEVVKKLNLLEAIKKHKKELAYGAVASALAGGALYAAHKSKSTEKTANVIYIDPQAYDALRDNLAPDIPRNWSVANLVGGHIPTLGTIAGTVIGASGALAKEWPLAGYGAAIAGGSVVAGKGANAMYKAYKNHNQHKGKVAANKDTPAKYDGGIYFSPQPIRARVGVTNAATKGESIAYNARNTGLAASTAGVLVGGAYLAGLKNPVVSKSALGLMAGGMGAIAGGNLYLKYSDNGRKAEAKLDDLKKHLQARGGLTHFGPTRFGKMKDSDGNEYITRGFTATRPAPTGRLLATQAKP